MAPPPGIIASIDNLVEFIIFEHSLSQVRSPDTLCKRAFEQNGYHLPSEGILMYNVSPLLSHPGTDTKRRQDDPFSPKPTDSINGFSLGSAKLIAKQVKHAPVGKKIPEGKKWKMLKMRFRLTEKSFERKFGPKLFLDWYMSDCFAIPVVCAGCWHSWRSSL